MNRQHRSLFADAAKSGHVRVERSVAGEKAKLMQQNKWLRAENDALQREIDERRALLKTFDDALHEKTGEIKGLVKQLVGVHFGDSDAALIGLYERHRETLREIGLKPKHRNAAEDPLDLMSTSASAALSYSAGGDDYGCSLTQSSDDAAADYKNVALNAPTLDLERI